jgi:hypothetical protein
VRHPVGVVAAERRDWIVRRTLVVFHRVGAAAFPAGGRRDHGGLRHLDQVVDFQRLDAGGVEDARLVLQRDARDALAHGGDLGRRRFVHEAACGTPRRAAA